jgi:hypothetical protein
MNIHFQHNNGWPIKGIVHFRHRSIGVKRKFPSSTLGGKYCFMETGPFIVNKIGKVFVYWPIIAHAFYYSQSIYWIIELSVKSRKDSTSNLSLVIHRVRFLKKPAKKYIRIQEGMKLRKPSILMVAQFHPVFPFSWAPPLLLHKFSLYLPVQLL